MPIDRLIVVAVSATGARDEHGEYIDGDVTAYRVWAERKDRSQEDKQTEGGSLDETRRNWRIRWVKAIADMPVSMVAVTDDGLAFNVLNMVEITGRRGELRRRWLEIEGAHTT